MKRFQFTLETILELRLEEEQEAEMILGKAMGEWNLLNDRKRERLAIREKNKGAFERQGADFLQNGLYMARIDQEIRNLEKEMESREEHLEELREKYRAARARREGLDKLKEKRKEEHNEIRKRAEAHALDDLLNNMKKAN
ncbi:MAG: flagellar FliJ family protein [Spirochaetales bacterium]|nr:flagellar FliJ family protein [Spirochaetales bacterium]